MTLLFGGNLLLSQISENLVKFDSIVPENVESNDAKADEVCESVWNDPRWSDYTCGMSVTTSTESGTSVTCIASRCVGSDAGKTCVENRSEETDFCPTSLMPSI